MHFVQGLDDLLVDVILAAAAEHDLGTEKVGQAGGGGSQDGEQADAGIEVGVFLGKLEEMAGGDAEHVDLGVKARVEHGVKVFDVHLAELARVEAMLEGIEVAGGAPRGRLGVGIVSS